MYIRNGLWHRGGSPSERPHSKRMGVERGKGHSKGPEPESPGPLVAEMLPLAETTHITATKIPSNGLRPRPAMRWVILRLYPKTARLSKMWEQAN